MKELVLLFSFCTVGLFAQTEEKAGTIQVKKPANELDSGSVYTIVEYMPEFPGGQAAMMQFVSSNVIYPKVAIDNALQGNCYVSFVVDTTGQLNDIRVIRGVKDCPECDLEALRMVRSMPKWSPGSQSGKRVRVRYLIPIKFKLQ